MLLSKLYKLGRYDKDTIDKIMLTLILLQDIKSSAYSIDRAKELCRLTNFKFLLESTDFRRLLNQSKYPSFVIYQTRQLINQQNLGSIYLK